MTSARTGSTFLTSHFNDINNVYNAGEFYSMWPIHFYRHINFLTDNNLNIPKSFINFMSHLYRVSVSPDIKSVINAHHSENRKDHAQNLEVSGKFPYTIDLIHDFIDEIEKLNLEYFINKHISQVSDYSGWTYNSVIDKADIVILNYRKSVLDVWISIQKANASNQWATKKYDPVYDNRIEWNKNKFLWFYRERYSRYYIDLKKELEETGKPYFVIEYEELQSKKNTCKYLQERLNAFEIDIPLNKPTNIKQSKNRLFYEDCFSNPEEFKSDYHSIKHSTTFTYGLK